MRRRCPKTERAGRRQAGVGKRARERVTADLVEHGAVAGLVQVEPSAIPRVDRMLQREQLPNIVEAQRGELARVLSQPHVAQALDQVEGARARLCTHTRGSSAEGGQ